MNEEISRVASMACDAKTHPRKQPSCTYNFTQSFPPLARSSIPVKDFPRFLPLTFTDETVNPGSATPASVCQICFQALPVSTCGKHAVIGGSKVAGVACSRTSIRSRTPISGFFFSKPRVAPKLVPYPKRCMPDVRDSCPKRTVPPNNNGGDATFS